MVATSVGAKGKLVRGDIGDKRLGLWLHRLPHERTVRVEREREGQGVRAANSGPNAPSRIRTSSDVRMSRGKSRMRIMRDRLVAHATAGLPTGARGRGGCHSFT